ncbi:FMN-binding protein [Actinomycetes bacterium M1A6_2h]
MRRITLWAMSTLSALVLLFSYHTSTEGTAVAASPVAESVSSTTAPPTSGAIAGAAPPVSAAVVADESTFTGTAASTRYGPVQVQITVSEGRITEATAVTYPTTNGRDQQINAKAVPVLESETVAAQSAEIDMVSGATYTSDGYAQSLQSALDQANL